MSQPVAKSSASAEGLNDLDRIFEDRTHLRTEFVNQQGWGDADIGPLNEDCAFRRYYRLKKGKETALVVDSIKSMEDKVAPKHCLSDVVRLAPLLTKAGVKVPEVYAYDLEAGYALLEDFGDVSFNKAMGQGVSDKSLYALATDVLCAFRGSEALQVLELDHYYDTLLHANRVDVVHWYRPAALYEVNPEGLMESYLAAWDTVEAALPPCPMAFLHGDFHMDNLMYLADQPEAKRCGVIDYQGAVIGPQPYDLANLLEDARRTVPEDIKRAMKEKYCTTMSKTEREIFDAWYRVLATQWHCRVIGLFVRLWVRDNKSIHVHHIPRLQNYIAQALKDPVLAPLAKWFKESGIDISKELPEFDLPRLRGILKLT